MTRHLFSHFSGISLQTLDKDFSETPLTFSKTFLAKVFEECARNFLKICQGSRGVRGAFKSIFSETLAEKSSRNTLDKL
jgi:hypothetical protein